jgi:hypothetical protein
LTVWRIARGRLEADWGKRFVRQKPQGIFGAMFYLNIFFTVAGIASIFTVAYGFYQDRRLKKGVRLAFLIDLRRLIERLERNKERFKATAEGAYNELWDVQHELEAIDSKLHTVFGVHTRQ